MFARKYGIAIARKAGEAREFFTDSGKEMDLANNELGFAYANKRNENLSDDQIDRLVHDRVRKGVFYVEDGKTFYRDL